MDLVAWKEGSDIWRTRNSNPKFRMIRKLDIGHFGFGFQMDKFTIRNFGILLGFEYYLEGWYLHIQDNILITSLMGGSFKVQTLPKRISSTNLMEDYANQNVPLNITIDDTFVSRYEDFVGRVRLIERTPETQKKGMMESKNLVNIDFSDDDIGRILRFKMRADTYYMIGFVQGDTLYEAPDTDGRMVLKGSKSLGFSVRHQDLERITLSYHSFTNAVKRLGNNDPGFGNEDTKRAFLTIVMFVAESARFRWLSHHFSNIFRNAASEPVEAWIIKLVKSWEFLSNLARDYSLQYNYNAIGILTRKDKIVIRNHDMRVFDKKDRFRHAAVCVFLLSHL